MIRLTIDGTEIVTREGNTILEAAREAGIAIPTLCFHEQLSPMASCRLCLVEVDGYEMPMTSCTTPALEGISVATRSERLLKLRREILNLLLTGHPLDCPQCDKGGECRVQELAYEFGIEKADYTALRIDRKEPYATPLIRYWETRCILCGRCVQGCREVSGRKAIEIKGRGFETRIGPTEPNDCISCGECLSLCPVGALTEALCPVKARIWQSERTDTTCPHCGFGCRLTLNVAEGKIITKVLSETLLLPNQTSLCVRGRFGYDFVNHEARLTEPFERVDGKKRGVDREAALKIAAENLQRLSAEGKGIGFIVSPRATNEEIFLISRIAALLKKSRVASSAAYHTGKTTAAFRRMGINPAYRYERLCSCKTILVAGADLLVNNHLLANKVREAVQWHGARVIVLDPLPCALSRIADAHLQGVPGEDAAIFNALSRRLILDGGHDKEAEGLEGFLEWRQHLAAMDEADLRTPAGVEAERLERAYGLIRDEEEIAVIFASGITNRGESLDALLNFCLLKGLHKRGLIMPAALQANAVGAATILQEIAPPDELLRDPGISGLFLYEDDPFHYLNAAEVKKGVGRKGFVAVCDLLPTAVMDHAHLVLPAAAFSEKEGTFLSGDGSVRSVKRALGTATGYEFLNDLLGRLGGRRYDDPAEIKDELQKMGIRNEEGDTEKWPEAGKARFSPVEMMLHRLPAGDGEASSSEPGAPAQDGAGRYRLILRDLFMNHHLCDREPYGRGIARIQEERLFISPEDAAALQVATGDSLCMESAAGAVTRPVTVKAGVKPGVLECVLGDGLRQGVPIRGEMLGLSARPSKVIAVSVRKVEL